MEGKEITKKLAVKSVDSIVFDSFKNLTSATEEERFKASLQLVQHISTNHDKEKQEKELQYILKRLIRGVGASTTTSRAGFFTTLVTLLKTLKSDYVEASKILLVAKKELHVGGNVANKEDADAIVGQILVCGALLRGGKAYESSPLGGDILSSITEILISSSKHRSYHNSLAYSFLAEFLQNVDENQFSTSIWPHIEPEIKKPWNKQTINTTHCLIIITNRFPNVITKKYLKTHFGGPQLLNSESFLHIFKIFFDNTSTEIIIHPAYEIFGKYMAHCKHLEEFWTSTVEVSLKTITKLREISVLKIITDIIENANPDKLQISKLFTHNFVKMMVTSLKGFKLKKDETLKAFYDDFFNALIKFSAKIENDTEKVAIIHKLILYPGIFCIEKYSSHRIIHQIINNLSETGIKEIFETYKGILLNKLPKNPENTEEQWLNVERQNAGYLLHTLICHKNVQTSFEWKTEQLKFFMTYGLFYVNGKGKIVKETKDDSSIISNDFASQLKNIFYSSLQSKLPRLKDEKTILLSLVETCNDILQRENYNKFLRNQISENIIKIWNEMYTEVHKAIKGKKQESQDTLQLVFHILLLQMGLQLFREPEMAEAAILDLEKCMAKAKAMHKVKHGKQGKNEQEQEPEWIEVVIDLFLHLLSQNNSALRNVVNSVFPHLCKNLTLTAVHQILSVLDMKDGNNPLSEGNENEDIVENQGMDAVIIHNDQINSKEKGNKSSDDESDTDDDDDDNDNDDNENDDDEDEDEEIIEEEEEEDGTITDKLRNAVSMALGSVKRDIDQDSIDLDDMDEEEGEKLDKALAAAFQLMKKPGENKKSKEYRIKATTVMHFRIRVLDLIEIYIQHNPSLLTSLEIMLALYEMIEFCGDNELKPLSVKVEKILLKLTGLRQFSNIEDVTEQNICDFLRIIIEKKVRASVFEVFNKLRAKCCVFLIACEKLLQNKEPTKLLNVFKEYINDFIKLRNPTLNMTLLCDIFKTRWHGIWHLTSALFKNGLSIDKTRVFRRIQVLELLDLLYKNHELIKQDLNVAGKKCKTIENCLQKHIESLTGKNQISLREFNTILDVLFVVHRCHMKISLEDYFDKETICNCIQAIRNRIKLDNTHSYNRFCTVYGIKIIKNSEVIKSNGLENGHDEIMPIEEGSAGGNHVQQKVNNIKKTKSKGNEIISNDKKEETSKRKNTITMDPRKQKKLKKQERLQKASEGLNGGISFTATSNNGEMLNGNISNNDESSD